MLNWKHSDELSRSSLPRQKTRTGLSANSAWDWMMISLALDLAEEIVDFNSTMLPLRATLQMWYMLFCQPTLHKPKWFLALFRSARTSCTTFGWFVPSRPIPQEKSGSLIYRHICLMNHEKTHQTKPLGQGGPLDALLTPWDPLTTPQSTPSDPYTGLLASLHS